MLRNFSWNDLWVAHFQNYVQHPHFLSTLDVKLKTRGAITGSWEPLVISSIIMFPNKFGETYCVCSVSYYYITPTAVGWCIAILHFFFTIILILILILITSPRLLSGDVLLFYVSFLLFLLLFFHSISLRCLDQTLWNLVGISCHVKLCC